MNDDPLIIAGKAYSSRLLVGTGKYKDFTETKRAIDAAGAEIVTVAIRRTNIGQEPGQPSLLEVLPLSQYTILRANCSTATIWSSWKCSAIRNRCFRICRKPSRRPRRW